MLINETDFLELRTERISLLSGDPIAWMVKKTLLAVGMLIVELSYTCDDADQGATNPFPQLL
jgi:hypothetical protein